MLFSNFSRKIFEKRVHLDSFSLLLPIFIVAPMPPNAWNIKTHYLFIRLTDRNMRTVRNKGLRRSYSLAFSFKNRRFLASWQIYLSRTSLFGFEMTWLRNCCAPLFASFRIGKWFQIWNYLRWWLLIQIKVWNKIFVAWIAWWSSLTKVNRAYLKLFRSFMWKQKKLTRSFGPISRSPKTYNHWMRFKPGSLGIPKKRIEGYAVRLVQPQNTHFSIFG